MLISADYHSEIEVDHCWGSWESVKAGETEGKWERNNYFISNANNLNTEWLESD
jgi:hypothetical protein